MKLPPKSESIEVTYRKDGQVCYLITSSNGRSVYTAWDVQDGKCEKLGKASSPPDLDKYIKL